MGAHAWRWQLVASRTGIDADGPWEVNAYLAAGPRTASGSCQWYIRVEYPDARLDRVTIRTGPLPTFAAAFSQAQQLISSTPNMAELGQAIAGGVTRRLAPSAPASAETQTLLDQIARFLRRADRSGSAASGLPLTVWPPIPVQQCRHCGRHTWVRSTQWVPGQPAAAGWRCECELDRSSES